MAREDFQNRIGRIDDGSKTVQRGPVAAPRRGRSMGLMSILFYGGLGAATAYGAVVGNQNYEAIKQSMAAGDGAAGLPIVVFLLGLAVFGLLILVALVQTLFRRRSGPSWGRILIMVAGFVAGSVAVTAMAA